MRSPKGQKRTVLSPKKRRDKAGQRPPLSDNITSVAWRNEMELRRNEQ